MLDPLIVSFGAGKSTAHKQVAISDIARWFDIPLALLALCQAGESYDVRKMVVASRRDHLRRLRVWRGGHDHA